MRGSALQLEKLPACWVSAGNQRLQNCFSSLWVVPQRPPGYSDEVVGPQRMEVGREWK